MKDLATSTIFLVVFSFSALGAPDRLLSPCIESLGRLAPLVKRSWKDLQRSQHIKRLEEQYKHKDEPSYKFAQATKQAYRNTSRWIFGPPKYRKHAQVEQTWTMATYRLFQEWAYPTMRWFTPLPLPRLNPPVNAILRKAWSGALKAPFPPEIKAELKKYPGAAKQVRKTVKFREDHPTATKIRQGFGYGFELGRIASLLLAYNMAVLLALDDEASIEEYETEDEFDLKPNQVRLITNLVPFPHLAIQIDDQIYSYGVTHLSRASIKEYLNFDTIVEQTQHLREDEPDEPIEEGVWAFVKRLQNTTAKWVYDVSGRDKARKVLEVVTLNLANESEKDQLRRYLESHLGSQYPNETGVMDCATMVRFALEQHTSIRIPTLVDASPAQVNMYFGALKTAGHPAVDKVFLVSLEKDKRRYWDTTTTAYTNLIESKVFVEFFAFNAVERLYMTAKHGSDDLHKRNKESSRVLQTELLEDVVEELDSDEFLSAWYDIKLPYLRKLALEGTDLRSTMENRKTLINDYIDKKIQESNNRIKNADTPLIDIHKAKHRELLLEERRFDLLLHLKILEQLCEGQ